MEKRNLITDQEWGQIELSRDRHQSFTKLDGVGEVEIKLVMQPPWSPDLMTEDARDQLGIF